MGSARVLPAHLTVCARSYVCVYAERSDKAGPKKWWAEVLEELERRGWTEGSPLPVLPEAVVDPSPADRFKNRIYVQSPNFVKEHEQWWGNVSAWWTIDAKPSDTASILKLKIAATDADHRNLVGPNRATANVQNRFAPDQFTLSCRDPTRLNPNNGRIEMRDLEDDETLESRGIIPGHEDGGPGGNGSLSIINLMLRPGAKPGYKPAPPAVVATPVIEVTQQVTTVTHTQQVTTTEALWLAPDGTTFMQRMEVITTTSTITTMTMTTYLLAQYVPATSMRTWTCTKDAHGMHMHTRTRSICTQPNTLALAALQVPSFGRIDGRSSLQRLVRSYSTDKKSEPCADILVGVRGLGGYGMARDGSGWLGIEL